VSASAVRYNALAPCKNRTFQMPRAKLLLLWLGLVACSFVSEGAGQEVSPQPAEADLLSGIRRAIADSHFGPPIEVTDLLRAPAISSNSWMVCIRGKPPSGPPEWTYSAFFKDKYVQSRYSADNDGCNAQQFHPFVDPANVTPPSTPAAPALKKHHRANAKCERGTEASPRPPKNIWPQLSDFPAAVRP